MSGGKHWKRREHGVQQVRGCRAQEGAAGCLSGANLSVSLCLAISWITSCDLGHVILLLGTSLTEQWMMSCLTPHVAARVGEEVGGGPRGFESR